MKFLRSLPPQTQKSRAQCPAFLYRGSSPCFVHIYHITRKRICQATVFSADSFSGRRSISRLQRLVYCFHLLFSPVIFCFYFYPPISSISDLKFNDFGNSNRNFAQVSILNILLSAGIFSSIFIPIFTSSRTSNPKKP